MAFGARLSRTVFPAALTALLLTLLPGPAAARYNPRWNWRTVSTEHFTVYYPGGHEAFARRVLALTPEVYGDVTGYLGFKTRPVPLVLNPGTDIFNGFYSPLPNRISLFETPVYTLRGFGSSTSDIVDLVFTHEFTHATHITTTGGLYHAATRVFGEGIGILNLFAPGWFIEGVTTNTETLFTDGGRGRAPEFLGALRSFTDDGTLWGLSAAGAAPYYRPPGARYYLTGYHMVEYLNRAYGPGTFARISRRQGAHPFRLADGAFRYETGVSPGTFYREFLADFTARADSVRAAAKAAGLPEGTVVHSDSLDGVISHFWTPEGRIRAVRAGYARHAALIEIDPASGAVVREFPLGTTAFLGGVRPLPDGRIVRAEPFYHPLGETSLDTADLVAIDPASGARNRLTRGAHTWFPAVSPDGTRIAATVRNGMWTDILLMDSGGANPRTLVSRPGLLWDAPAFSPDGTVLAAAMKEGGRNGIALIDVSSGNILLPFGMDERGYNEPSFSPDGRWLVFASDRSGVWNIYSRCLANGRTFRLTSVPNEASEPLVSPDGRTLSFLSLSEGQNQLRTMPFAPAAGGEITLPEGGSYTPPDTAPDDGPIAGSRGIPLRAYAPFIHVPAAAADEDGSAYGLFLMGGDPVGLNAYSVSGYYGTTSRRFGYDATVTNRSFWPAITARGYDIAVEDAADSWYRERGGELSFQLPAVIHRIAPDIRYSSLVLGARVRKYDALENFTLDRSRDFSSALFAEASFQRIPESPARDLVTGWGQSLYAGYEGAGTAAGSEMTGHNTVAAFVQYAPSPFRHHGFAFTVAHQNQRGPIAYDVTGTIPRGYDDDGTAGGFDRDNTLTFSLDYRFPLWYADRGLGMTMCHLHLLHGAFFADHGAGWDGGFRRDVWERNARTSLGGALRAETTILYLVPLDLGVQAGYRTVEEDWFVRALFAAPLTGSTSLGSRRPGLGEFLRRLKWE